MKNKASIVKKARHPSKDIKAIIKEVKKKSIHEARFESGSGFFLVCDYVEDMLQAEVVCFLVTKCLNRFDILQNINAKSSSRSFDALKLPYTFCKVLGSVCSD